MPNIARSYAINLNHLAIFQAVAEEGSISRGAERLFISQPAVSKQLAEFERSIGTLLFDRLPRGVRLTEAGELLSGYARRLFALEADAERALAELRGLSRGRVAIGASLTIGEYLLPGILARFHREYPGLDVTLEIGNTDAIQHRLAEGRLDVGLTEGLPGAEGLEAEVFMEDELVAVADPDRPILREGTVTLERLCREPFVIRELGSGTRLAVERVFAEQGVKVRPALTLGSTEAIKRAVAAGAGVAIVSRLTITVERDTGRLALVPVAGLVLRRPLHRLRLRGRNESDAVRAFLKMLQAELFQM